MLHPPRQHFLTIVLLHLYLSSLISGFLPSLSVRYSFIHDCLAILVGFKRNIPLTVSLSLELWDLNSSHIRPETQEQYFISLVTTLQKRFRGDNAASDQLNEETAS